jgi:hypothetical protein
MKQSITPSQLVVLLFGFTFLLGCGTCAQAQTDYLAFPPQQVAAPAMLPDVSGYPLLQMSFSGSRALAAQDSSYFNSIGSAYWILDAQGHLLSSTKRSMPWTPVGPIAPCGSGWGIARTKQEYFPGQLYVAPSWTSYAPELVWLDEAGNQSSAVSLDTPLGMGSYDGVTTSGSGAYSKTRIAGQGGFALAVWGVSGAVPGTPFYETVGRWVQPGEPLGARMPLLPGTYFSHVTAANGAWLVSGLGATSDTLSARWLTTGNVPTEPVFEISQDAKIYPQEIHAEPITEGAVVGWSRNDFVAGGGATLVCHFVNRTGVVGPRLTLGRTGFGTNERFSLCEQSDGSLRAFWMEGGNAYGHWRTAMLVTANANTLNAIPSAEGEPVGYFDRTQAFTAAIGPDGPVTLYTDSLPNSSGTGFIRSMFGIPAYPLGSPERISGTESSPREPKVAAVEDGYICAWLENRIGRTSVWVMRYDTDGRPLWVNPVDAMALRTVPSYLALATPAISYGGGAICVGWMERGTDEYVRVQRLLLNGSLIGPPVTLESQPGKELRGLRLSHVGGRFSAVWRERVAGISKLAHTWLGTDGVKEGGTIYLNSQLTVSAEISSRGNEALLVGRENTTTLRAAIMDSSGVATHLSAPLSTAPNIEIASPAVAWSPAANAYLVAWFTRPAQGESMAMHARRISATGAFMETEPIVLSPAAVLFSSGLSIAATDSGWWVGHVRAFVDSTFPPDGLHGILVAANGTLSHAGVINASSNQRMAGENLTAAAGPNGGVLIGGEILPSIKASLRLIFPAEKLPQLAMTSSGSSINLAWSPTVHFPAGSGILEGSLNLKDWFPISQAVQSSPTGSATVNIAPTDSRCFFRLQAKLRPSD